MDLGSEYLHGLETARAASDAQQRLSLERTRLQMQAQAQQQETQARAEVQQRENLEQSARLQTQTAYREAELGLQQAHLQALAHYNQQRTREAAIRMADQHAFANDLARGVPIEQALYAHPMANPASAIAAHKDTLAIASQRLDLAKHNLDLRKQEIADREKKQPAPGTISLQTVANNPFSPTLHVPINSPLINQVLGTNAPPGTGTNYQGAPTAPAPSATPSAPPDETGPPAQEVKRRTKDGRIAIYNAGTKEFLRYGDDQ